MATSNVDFKKLAEVGAAVRVSELRAELESLYKWFPGLRGGRKASVEQAPTKPLKPRLTMTAAQKKAVSIRMKKYWAGRRAAAGKK